MINERSTKTTCPVCKKAVLIAIEMPKGNVCDYRCPACSAQLDAEILHDWQNKQHFWVGKLRNPAFCNMNNSTPEERLVQMRERETQGVPEYLGRHLIEEINQTE